MSKVSIKDVARETGFSIATVSRVINNTGGYSKATEQAVLDVVKKMGYSTDLTAKALRTNSTKSIAIIIPDITNEYFANIVRQVDLFFIEKGYSVLILDSNEDTKFENILLNEAINKNVDGLIFLPSQQTTQELKDYPVPTVYVDRNLGNSKYYVISDNETGGQLAAKELINSGCKNILFLKDSHQTMPIIQRELGLITYIIEHDRNIKINALQTLPTYDQTRIDLKKELIKDASYDGIFASNDIMAVSAIHVAQSLGLRVPEDIKVIGFDDISLSRYSFPSVSTIRQNTDAMGIKASQLLYDLMTGRKVDKKEIIVPVELIRRESTL